MKLIDVERFDVFVEKCPDGRDVVSFMAGVTAVLNEIDKSPVINLVLCKDCKHSEPSLKKNCVYCEVNDRAVKRDWYCADGKRREEDETN